MLFTAKCVKVILYPLCYVSGLEDHLVWQAQPSDECKSGCALCFSVCLKMLSQNMPPIHAGEILQEEFLAPLKLSANKLAAALSVPTNRITAIIKGQRGITGDTALRLAEYFSTTPQFWMNLQSTYELRLAETTLTPETRRHIKEHAPVLPAFA